MLEGTSCPPDDIRQSLFRALRLHIPHGSKKLDTAAYSELDAIDAVTAPLYLDAM
jgi:hypothetical protein